MYDFEAAFRAAHDYETFLDRYATDEHRRRWAELHKSVRLTDEQQRLFAGFVREMNVLCLAGAWCGDCVAQCPIFEHFARATPRIRLRFADRDADPALADELRVCGGSRVPVLVFLSEDFAESGRYGDRTLSRYRAMADELSGAACATGIVDFRALAAVTADWCREFERIQLMLRTSPRLRQKHGD